MLPIELKKIGSLSFDNLQLDSVTAMHQVPFFVLWLVLLLSFFSFF